MSGLNDSFPASANAVTISGLAMKFMVAACPSLRRGKLRLYEVTIALGAPGSACGRRHWPMQGPHAFASTAAPMSLSDCNWPSRSMVARTCAEPGVTMSGIAAFTPRAFACSAISAARLMSSYDELVQLPISAVAIASGKEFRASRTSAASCEIGRARSGECGPTTWGSSRVRSSSSTRS